MDKILENMESAMPCKFFYFSDVGLLTSEHIDPFYTTRLGCTIRRHNPTDSQLIKEHFLNQFPGIAMPNQDGFSRFIKNHVGYHECPYAVNKKPDRYCPLYAKSIEE